MCLRLSPFDSGENALHMEKQQALCQENMQGTPNAKVIRVDAVTLPCTPRMTPSGEPFPELVCLEQPAKPRVISNEHKQNAGPGKNVGQTKCNSNRGFHDVIQMKIHALRVQTRGGLATGRIQTCRQQTLRSSLSIGESRCNTQHILSRVHYA